MTPGSGKTVAAEDAGGGGVLYQQVKLIDATANSTTVTGVAANPLQVSLANTAANSTAVKVDNSAVTQPVSGTVTANLGTIAGVATAAKQPALGTAGSASSDVLTIQGVASMTAVKVDNSAVTQPVSQKAATIPASTTMQNGATASANGTSLNVQGYVAAVLNVVSSVAMSGGTTINFEISVDDTTWVTIAGHQIGVNGSLATTTTTDGDFRFSTAGYKSLRARISAYSAGTITVIGFVSPVSSAPTAVALATGANTIGALSANQSVNMAQVAGTTTDTNSGTKSAGTQRIVIATDQPQLTNALKVDGSAATQPVSGTVTADTELPAAAALGTSMANPTTPAIGAFNVLWFNSNGTWERQRQLATGEVTNGTGTGISASSMFGQFDDVSPTAPSENQFSLVRISSRREVYTQIRDAAGNERGVNVTSGNALTVDTGSATGAAVPASAFYKGLIAKTALPAAGSDGNLTGAMGDKFGRQVVVAQGMRDLINPITQLTLTSTTTETSLIAAVASTFNDLLSLCVVNTSATPTQVDFRDSTGGTVRQTLYVPAGDMRGIVLQVPMPQAAVNTAWTAKCGTSVASIIITGQYIANK